MSYALFLKKQNFKFSSSHFTIFSEKSAEFLHGHNYQVAVKILIDTVNPKTEMAVDFNVIKKAVRTVCDQMDEKILLPKKSTFLKISASPHYKKHTEVRFQDRVYCFPDNEIFYVDANNITSESLARFIHEKLEDTLESALSFEKLSVTIYETAGQAASYFGLKIK
jgi:6-pyruvoyltetrahydropterin/6-carboxytetrahydropterin synthase